MQVLYANLFPEKWRKLYTLVFMRLNYSALRVYGLLVQLYTNPSPVVCARCPRQEVHARPADWFCATAILVQIGRTEIFGHESGGGSGEGLVNRWCIVERVNYTPGICWCSVS